MKKFVFALLLLTVNTAFVFGSETLEIRILRKFKPKKIVVYSKDSPKDKTVISYKNDSYQVITPEREYSIRKYMHLYGSKADTYIVKTGVVKREYKGVLELTRRPDAKDITMILRTTMEDYIPGVLAVESEMGVRSEESIKALSVVARTFALENRNKHGKYGYDMCDTTHCQKFNGIPKKNMHYWNRMANFTKDEYLKSKNSKGIAFYNANCGGSMESAENVWSGGSDISYRDTLGGEVLCSHHHDFSWQSVLPKSKVNAVLSEMTGEKVRSSRMKALVKTPGGRVTRIKFICRGNKEYIIDAYRFMAAYGRENGWKKIPSLLFEIVNKWTGYEISGHGYGHGVGMCMAGAYQMARKGYSYERILAHYFAAGDIYYISSNQPKYRSLANAK